MLGKKTNTYWQSSRTKASLIAHRVLPIFVLLSLASFLFAIPATPQIVLNGVTTVGSAKKICVGQLIKASVMTNAVPIDINNPGAFHFSWTIGGGRPLCNFDVLSSGTWKTDYVAPNSSYNAWYFTEPASSVTISCIVTPPSPNAPYTLSTTVVVQGPTRLDDYSAKGTVQFVSGYNGDPCTLSTWSQSAGLHPTAFMLWGAPNDISIQIPNIWGCFKKDRIVNPTFLTTEGQWSYVQTYEMNDSDNGVPTVASGLDTSFPYTDGWNSTGTDTPDYYFIDAPGRGYETSPDSYAGHPRPLAQTIDRLYHLYIFYKPPQSSVGPSIYVPLAKIDWQAKGSNSAQDLLLSSYSQQDNGTRFLTDTSYPIYPEWSIP